MTANLAELPRVDHRPEERRGVEGIARLDLGDAFDEPFGEVGFDRLVDENAARRRAFLAGAAERAFDGERHGFFEISLGVNIERVLSAHLALRAAETR